MTEQNRAVVAVAHTKDKHRSQQRVLALVREALDHLGGMQRFVRPGQTVLIKPNQTVFYSAEEGCTTDPLLVGACIILAKEAGAGRVQVAESSGGFFDSIQCMRITGVAAVAEREGAELIDLGSNSLRQRHVPIPNGRVIKDVPLPEPLLEADVIIDCPKAKNHHTDPISGALKNWMGCLNKEWRQYNHGDEAAYGRFMDIMTVSKPDLCVVDALICGEGDGPIANLPHFCGTVLASTDPVATDAAICTLMGHDWRNSHHIRQAVERGLGIPDPIEYLGTPIEQVAFKAWPGHKGYEYLPINFLVGKGVSLPGTVGHVKSVVDSMLRRGDLQKVIWLKGTPTIMMGECDDPDFEQHLKEGPYLVFDDAALPKYKNDPRVYFVPGHPVLREAMPELFKGLGVKLPGNMVMKWEEWERREMHNLKYGTPYRKTMAVGKPVGALVLAATAAIAGVALAKGAFSESRPKRQIRRRAGGLASRLASALS